MISHKVMCKLEALTPHLCFSQATVPSPWFLDFRWTLIVYSVFLFCVPFVIQSLWRYPLHCVSMFVWLLASCSKAGGAFFDFLTLSPPSDDGPPALRLERFLAIPCEAEKLQTVWKLLLKAQVSAVFDWVDQLRTMTVEAAIKSIPSQLRSIDFMDAKKWTLGPFSDWFMMSPPFGFEF